MKLRNSPIKGRPQSILLQLITVAYTGHPRLETHELLRFKSINTAMNEYTVPFRSDRSCRNSTQSSLYSNKYSFDIWLKWLGPQASMKQAMSTTFGSTLLENNAYHSSKHWLKCLVYRQCQLPPQQSSGVLNS